MGGMTFAPNASPWVQQQLEAIDAAGGDTSVVDVMGLPVVVVTMKGAKTGEPRRVPLMRVEHNGEYLAVGSKGGDPKDPVWVNNIRTNPEVTVLDGTTTHTLVSRQIDEEPLRSIWWERAVLAYPPYAEYQTKTDRQIPLFLLSEQS